MHDNTAYKHSNAPLNFPDQANTLITGTDNNLAFSRRRDSNTVDDTHMTSVGCDERPSTDVPCLESGVGRGGRHKVKLGIRMPGEGGDRFLQSIMLDTG